MITLLPDLTSNSAEKFPDQTALTQGALHLTYEALADEIQRTAQGFLELGVGRGDRIAFYLDKRFETVVVAFASARAGAVFVPVNPVLKTEQVCHILRDCNVKILVTTADRYATLAQHVGSVPDLVHVVLLGDMPQRPPSKPTLHHWDSLMRAGGNRECHRVIDTDMVSILYTSGSTGKPKGVVLSHRNMVAGAKSVAHYLGNTHDDVILSALPLSFDAGFSQLTTGFLSGARVVLLNYLLPRDVISTMVKERVTGLTAVPPLWIQLSQIAWPESLNSHLRYIANTGGRMPREILERLRRMVPATKPYLMYGLTEAFRSTYLPPEEIDRRPDSIGKAIPNAEILVLRADGTECAPEESGELVHRGALVSMGYWNDAEKTAERFKPLPVGVGGRESGMMITEMAVFSGDTVRRDADGFIYFIARADEMIKTSGYRVSPTEIEEALYSTGKLSEIVALGVPHPVLGQEIVVVATSPDNTVVDVEALLSDFRTRMPNYMVPSRMIIRTGALPRNPNGKIDRKSVSAEVLEQVGTLMPGS